MDLKTMTDEELAELAATVGAEQARRRAEADATAAIDAALAVYAVTAGMDRGEGAAWVQPVGAHDSYPSGAIVSHGGKTWESLVTANVHEPSISGWRELAVEGEVAEWVQPTGAHDAYQTGDLVIFEGQTYQSTIDSNTWSPSDYPQGWALIE